MSLKELAEIAIVRGHINSLMTDRTATIKTQINSLNKVSISLAQKFIEIALTLNVDNIGKNLSADYSSFFDKQEVEDHDEEKSDALMLLREAITSQESKINENKEEIVPAPVIVGSTQIEISFDKPVEITKSTTKKGNSSLPDEAKSRIEEEKKKVAARKAATVIKKTKNAT